MKKLAVLTLAGLLFGGFLVHKAGKAFEGFREHQSEVMSASLGE